MPYILFLFLDSVIITFQLSEPSWGGEIHSPGPDSAPDKVCGVCLTEVKGSPEVSKVTSPVRFYRLSSVSLERACVFLQDLESQSTACMSSGGVSAISALSRDCRPLSVQCSHNGGAAPDQSF